jgi:hypothetical protein
MDQFLSLNLFIKLNKSIILVSVPCNFSSGPTLLAPLSSVSLVPPNLIALDQGG